MSSIPFRDALPRRPVDELITQIDGAIGPLSVETIAPSQAMGRALAREVVAPADVPGFDRAAMDGYAVRSGDRGPRQLIGEAYPARPFDGKVQPGQMVRIMTGAPMPPGADAVIPIEAVGPGGEMPELPPGKNVGRRGEDVTAGSVLFSPGRLLRPQDVGLLAAVGITSVFVHRIPRISILVTGNELLPAGTAPSGYRIVDSNSPMLAELVRRDGGEADVGPIVPDERDALREALLMADGDLILVCGGSSVGAEDHVASLLADLGEIHTHGVALKPGAPAGFASLRGRYVFLLPGNPVSCLCAYDLFAGRALRRMVGRGTRLPYMELRAPMAEAVSSTAGRVDYLRVTLQADGQVRPLSVRGASVLSTTTQADGFVLIDAAVESLKAGETVSVHLYDTRRGSYTK
jgi:molybdopterin molybdotransferase